MNVCTHTDGHILGITKSTEALQIVIIKELNPDLPCL